MVWFDPFEEMEELMRQYRKRFQRIFGPLWLRPIEMESFPVDMSETDEDIIIKADLPGFSKEEISIKATEDSIEISAEHKEKKIEKTERMYRAERKFGTLRRFLTLPVKVDYTRSEAEFKDGVLTIKLPKKEKKKAAKEIKIK